MRLKTEHDRVPAFDPMVLAGWTGGVWSARPPERICGIGHDTREPLRGRLYVALRGARYDGHAFLAQARAAGACGALINAGTAIRSDALDWPCLRVADTGQALQRAAVCYRQSLPIKVIGITGSMGKTTVKDWVSAMLALRRRTWQTRGNWNNAIGLPLCLLAMPPDTECVVIEIGTSAPGEIRALCALARPDAAIMTRIGPAHLEAFGTLEAIADEKADLLRCLPAEGFAVLDREDPFYAYFKGCLRCHTITVGQGGGADFRMGVGDPADGLLHLVAPDRPEGVALPFGLPGAHQARNALLALAAARRLGADWRQIARCLAAPTLSPMRWAAHSVHGILFINDAYNANPESMRAALTTFAELNGVKRKFLVLGDMLELGPTRAALHRALGRDVAHTDWTQVILVGEHARKIRDGAVAAGFPVARLALASDALEAATLLGSCAQAGDAVLLKASRGMRLERVLDAFMPANDADAAANTGEGAHA